MLFPRLLVGHKLRTSAPAKMAESFSKMEQTISKPSFGFSQAITAYCVKAIFAMTFL
jgi:hypothetical protein